MNNPSHHLSAHRTVFSRDGFWPLLLLLAGFVCITMHHSDYFRAIPGDMGDARFNNMILEHLFRWVIGKDTSLWSPPYFYPYPGTLTFSDNHFGTGAAYVLMRLVGLGPEGAFIGWYSLAAPLNFACCYYSLRQMGLGPRGSAVAAFIFAFSLNVSAQHGHAQLSYRFATPLSVLAFHRLLKNHAPKQLVLAILWVTLQLYCSIYLGYFLTLLLTAYAIMYTLTTPGVGEFRPHQAIFLSIREAWRDRQIMIFAAIAFCLVALGFLFYPYMQYSSYYHLGRDYAEIRKMLPRPEAYLLADGSIIWGNLSAHFTSIPMRWEHQMFFGASAYILAIFGISNCWNRATKAALGAVLILVALTMDVHDHSLYTLIYNFPLVNAVRAVARIGLILIFPVALLAGLGFDWLASSANSRLLKSISATAFILFMLFEYAAFRTVSVPLKQLDQRLTKLVSQLPAQLPSDAIVYAPPSNDGGYPFDNELDGMRLVAAINRPTLNGYSGYVPRSFNDIGLTPCDIVNNRLTNYASLVNAGYDEYVHLVHRVIVLGDTKGCQPASTLINRSHFGGKVPQEVVAGTRLEVLNPRIVDGKLLATLQIDNGSNQTLESISDDNHPVRFSWRLVPVNAEIGPYDSWDPRKDLSADVIAGGKFAAIIIITPPKQPGLYRIEASLLQENLFWFHAYGMPIGRSRALINVGENDSLSIQLEKDEASPRITR
jgi:hypothetical protein